MHLLQRIYPLLELDVVWGQLSLSCLGSALYEAAAGWVSERASSHLVLDIANLLLDILLSPGRPWGEGSTVAALSAHLSSTSPAGVGGASGHAYEMFFPNAEILPRLSIVGVRVLCTMCLGCGR